jgi:hypothetical protein
VKEKIYNFWNSTSNENKITIEEEEFRVYIKKEDKKFYIENKLYSQKCLVISSIIVYDEYQRKGIFYKFLDMCKTLNMITYLENIINIIALHSAENKEFILVENDNKLNCVYIPN